MPHAKTESDIRHGDRRIHKAVRLLIAVIACIATYALLMALFDTRRPTTAEPPAPSTSP
jgi:hypothetical protein